VLSSPRETVASGWWRVASVFPQPSPRHEHAPSPTLHLETWRNNYEQSCASGAIPHPLRSPCSQAAPLYRPHSAPPYRARPDSGLPERASHLDDPLLRPGPLSCKEAVVMVELHLSLRCSEWFVTTATIKVQAGAVFGVLLSAARLLVQAALHPIH
jgi:hypothetical protein